MQYSHYPWRFSCACKHRRQTKSQKVLLSNGQWISLKTIGAFPSAAVSFDPHMCSLAFSTYIGVDSTREHDRDETFLHIISHEVSCDFFFFFSCVMLDLKLEVTAYDCFNRTMMQSGAIYSGHWTICFIIYNVHAFPKRKLSSLKEYHLCFCVHEKQYRHFLFSWGTFLSTLPYQWGFSLKGLALWWLVLNFWTQHPHRDGVAFNDGFQSGPRWLQYQALWKETFPPLAIVDIPFHH